MTMLSKLFKPAWQHKDPERRIAAISAFSESDAEQQETLEAMALSDADVSVRNKATSLLTSLRTLEKLRLSEQGIAAKTRLNLLLSSKDEAHQQLVSEFFSEAEPETVIYILCYCPNSPIRQQALELVQNQEHLVSVASDSEFADTRETASAAVERLDLLEPLWKKVRERDKNLAKTLHERIEKLREVEQHRKEIAGQAEKIVSAMAELKDSVWTPQYNLKFLALVNQWQQIEAEAEPDIGNKYRELAIGVEAVVIEHRQVLEAIEKQQQLVEDAEQLQSDAQTLGLAELELQMERWSMLRRIWLDSLALTVPNEALGQRFDQVGAYFLALERLTKNQSAFAKPANDEVVEADASEEAPAELKAEPEPEPEPAPETDAESVVESEDSEATAESDGEQADATEKTEQAGEQEKAEEEVQAEEELIVEEEVQTEEELKRTEASPEPKPAELAEEVAKEISEGPDLKQQVASMKAALKAIDWPASLEEPEALAELKGVLKSQETVLKDQAAEQKQQVESFGKQIGRLNGAVRRGDLRMARGVFNKVEAKFQRLGADQQKRVQEQWDKAAAAYKEMLDWKEFAIQPKFIELCEQMEALAGSGTQPKQSPQQQAEAIKKLQQAWKKLEALAPDEVWQRFQAAGDKAFEPCAEFYAKQEKLRAANLEQRKSVLEKLRELAALPDSEEWKEQPDWKSLRTNLREIREDWRKYGDVDQQKCRKLGKKYADLARELEKHIKAECQTNLARKQQLVDRAIAMSSMDSAAISLDQLKELQGSWKHIGITERRDDQKMWKAFQEACDAVFAKHRQRVDESRAEEKAQSDAAKKIIQSIRALAKTQEGAAPDEAKMAELLEEYAQLPAVHEPVQKALNRDLNKATDQVQAAVKKFKRERQNQYLVEMQRRAEICANLESLDPEKDTVKAEKLLAKWEEQSLPSEAAQLMEQRKEAALAAKFGKAETDQAERARRLICIELEALLGKATPSEDQALKMEYQLEQMRAKGLGANTSLDTRAATEEARKAWYSSPAAAKKVQQELDERFHKLIQADA